MALQWTTLGFVCYMSYCKGSVCTLNASTLLGLRRSWLIAAQKMRWIKIGLDLQHILHHALKLFYIANIAVTCNLLFFLPSPAIRSAPC